MTSVKGIKQKYKQYTITCKEDALTVLGSLIAPVMTNIEKYKRYIDEAIELCKEYADDENISADKYENIHDKAMYCQREMLTVIADHQSTSFSYKDIRNKFVKSGYLNRALDAETVYILDELLNVRNWTFHNPQSRLVAEREIAEKNIPKELRGIATLSQQINPIILVKVTEYTNRMLKSFISYSMLRLSMFDIVLEEMKRDYQEIFDSLLSKQMPITLNAKLLLEDSDSEIPVQYVIKEIVSDVNDIHSDIANISMAIQKGRYEGTNESFEKYTGKKISMED